VKCAKLSFILALSAALFVHEPSREGNSRQGLT
jgi:hypothetical protein